MQVTSVIHNAIPELLAADVATLAAVTAMKVSLVAAPFTPAKGLVDPAGLTLATFTGSAPKSATAGTQQVFSDPALGTLTLQIMEPAGGWTWECTATPGAPETIHGWILTNTAGTVIYGMDLLPAPVTIDAVGQAVVIPRVKMDFSPNSPS